jgi:hypothetical protein
VRPEQGARIAPKKSTLIELQCLPAGGTQAALNLLDLDTSRWQLTTERYTNFPGV